MRTEAEKRTFNIVCTTEEFIMNGAALTDDPNEIERYLNDKKLLSLEYYDAPKQKTVTIVSEKVTQSGISYWRNNIIYDQEKIPVLAIVTHLNVIVLSYYDHEKNLRFLYTDQIGPGNWTVEDKALILKNLKIILKNAIATKKKRNNYLYHHPSSIHDPF